MRSTANLSQKEMKSLVHLAVKAHREPIASPRFRAKDLIPNVDELRIQFRNGRVHDLNGNKNWETRKQGST